MREIHREIVGALIVSTDGFVLFGKKYPGKGGVYDDACWHIPGGGLEAEESHREGIIREVREETSLDISSYNMVLLDDTGTGQSKKRLSSGEEVICTMTFFVYRIDIDKTHDAVQLPDQSDEFVEMTWIPKDTLLEYRLTPPSVELFQRITL